MSTLSINDSLSVYDLSDTLADNMASKMTNCKIVLSRGSLLLCGEYIDFIAMKWKNSLKSSVPVAFFENQNRRDAGSFHITLLDKRKLSAFSVESGKTKEAILEEVSSLLSESDLSAFVDIGVGKVSDPQGNVSYFVIVFFEKLKASLKLESSNFHITLAFKGEDVHMAEKNIKNLLKVPFNFNLQPTSTVVNELKALIRVGDYDNAIGIYDCIDKLQITAEIGELYAMILFKQGRYQECLDLAKDLLRLPLSSKLEVLLNIRIADATIYLGDYRFALLPIWRALSLLENEKGNDKFIALKHKACLHLIGNLLVKCTNHGYLRIDSIPVSRKMIHETETSLTIDDSFALELFAIYQKINKERYHSIISDVTKKIGAISYEKFDENHMPLESRWIVACDSKNELHVLQRNFSYVWPNLLAVSSTPRHKEDIEAMSFLGISLVITLTEEEPLKSDWFKNGSSSRNIFVPVPNYNPPSISVADRIVWEVACELKRGGKSLIHCGGGKGRAGTASAIIIMTLGMDVSNVVLCESCLETFRPFGTCSDENCHFSKTPIFDPSTCLNIVRTLRPESLETVQQEAFLKTYSSTLWKRSTVPSEKDSFLMEELNEDTLEVHGALPIKLPKVIILSGLPGSGKSTFSKSLQKKLDSFGVVVSYLNQDEFGGRDSFENAVGPAFKASCKNIKSLLIIDRCNARKSDRTAVLQLLHNPEKEIIMFIHFDFKEALCLQRIKQRFDHLTLKPENARRAVKNFQDCMEFPDLEKENMKTLLVIKSIADSKMAIELISSCCSSSSKTSNNSERAGKLEKFFKFPRTEHLFNVGGATRDDLVLSPQAFKTFFEESKGKVITMEEKIDGANVGFSINETGKILCQNRSHYVDSKYHFQFQSLGSFIFQKRESLERILKDGWILYGEWMFAKHSIHYTALPDIFIAFDLFSPSEGKFLDRQSFYSIMSTTNIEYVKPLDVFSSPKSSTPDMLKKILTTTKSAFSDSLIEGIYFRWDQDGKLKTRAKLVRSDFICGDEHWSKGKITLNGILNK